ncbi:glycoside hydrolase family 51 protein [Chiua virens]|nr:glycoside hydrolase family 51 protein [Chiua virens]
MHCHRRNAYKDAMAVNSVINNAVSYSNQRSTRIRYASMFCIGRKGGHGEWNREPFNFPSALYVVILVLFKLLPSCSRSRIDGQMFEDFDSGDGGLYAELLQNRAFQQVTPNTAGALYAWSAINNTAIDVIADPSPVSSALPNSLQLTVPAGASGQLGFGNSGYFGIKVDANWTYNASFYYKFPEISSFNGTATVALQSSTGQVYTSASLQMNGSQTTWRQVALRLTPTSSSNSTANNFTITFDGADVAGQTINFAMFSLFPPTFNNRENGMRIDLANALYEMKPSFFRLPGGNNMGITWASRWVWNATLGPLENRPGREGTWGYINTDGLGLLEYMYFCEDLGMEPIMAVWDGYSIGNGVIGGNISAESLPENELAPYIQTAINQIDFVIGDPDTNEYAALRASLGHPEPFTLNYVEIGNEDFFASESYTYRWRDFAGNLTAAFPQLKFIATSYPFNPVLDPVPQQYDLHLYNTSLYFIEHAFDFDSYERNGTYYLQGEYGVDLLSGHNYPVLEDALGTAAYMTGFERNGDIVFAACYAPLLVNIDSSDPGINTPGQLVAFDAANIYPSTHYYVQQLFSTYRGTEYLPSTLPTFNGTLYWSVTSDTNVSSLYIKVVNTDATPTPMTFELPFQVASHGNVVLISGASNASNTPTTPDAVIPVMSSMTFGETFNYTAPAYSVSALSVSIL